MRVSTLLLPGIVYDCAFLTRADAVPDFLCGPVGCSMCPQATLGFNENNPPTWVDAQLVITGDSTVPTEREPPSPTSVPLKSQVRELEPRPNDEISVVIDKSVTAADIPGGWVLLQLSDRHHDSHNTDLVASLHLLTRLVPSAHALKPSSLGRHPHILAA